MSAESITQRGREAAVRLMSDTVRVGRRSDSPVTDPATGKVTYPEVHIYEGPGRVQANALQDREVPVAGASWDVAQFTVQVPFDTDLRSGDVLTVLASGTDALMVDRSFRVDTVPRKTHATALRAAAEEVT